MEIKKCPICGSEFGNSDKFCMKNDSSDSVGNSFYCSKDNIRFLTTISITNLTDDLLLRKVFNLIREFLVNINKGQERYTFYYSNDENQSIDYDRKRVNIKALFPYYPKNTLERVRMGFKNIVNKFSMLGDLFQLQDIYPTLIFSESSSYGSELDAFFSLLKQMDLVESFDRGWTFRVSSKGWEQVQNTIETTLNQGFIAMRFFESKSQAEEDLDLNNIYTSFYHAIKSCGYKPLKIDNKQHNNQIVPEILFEIRRSKFIVVDISYQNYGAYYEAGYAQGQNKEVIFCCKKETFNSIISKPHFDVIQRSMVLWDDYDDLKISLQRRIEATIGTVLNDI